MIQISKVNALLNDLFQKGTWFLTEELYFSIIFVSRIISLAFNILPSFQLTYQNLDCSLEAISLIESFI